jgi:large subunit ribosomal protein L35
MPKLKTNRGAAKRFKVTGKGALKHRAANRSHILTKKRMKRKRHLRGSAMVNPSDVRSVRRMLTLQ